MREKWINEIKGMEHISGYKIREDGIVISYMKYGGNSKKYYVSNEGKELKGYRDTKGYLLIDLGRKNRAKKIHRLVAKAFIPNPNNKTQVNHIDGNKANNNVSNLEWNTQSENIRHMITNGLRIEPRLEQRYNYDKECKGNKKVLQYDLEGNFIQEYVSLAQACRAVKGKSYSNISKVCNNKHHSAYGYVWKFK